MQGRKSQAAKKREGAKTRSKKVSSGFPLDNCREEGRDLIEIKPQKEPRKRLLPKGKGKKKIKNQKANSQKREHYTPLTRRGKKKITLKNVQWKKAPLEKF